MVECYRIRNWELVYENNRTREVKVMQWLPLPIKLDGDGYTTIVEHKNGAGLFGCFVSILEIAAKCDPRGTLTRSNGTAHTCDTLARISRMPATLVRECIDVCVSECKWIEIIDLETGATISQEGATISQEPALHYSTLQDNTEQDNTGAARTQKSKPAIESKEKIPPTIEEVTAYCIERKNNVDANRFFDYYESKGWIVGRSKMKSWKASVRTWEKNAFENTSRQQYGRQDVTVEEIEAQMKRVNLV